MPWRQITLWTAITTLLIVAAGVAFLLTADLGFLKPQIEDRVTNASGRAFSIDGELSIRLGRRGRVTANDIRWQNAEWAEGHDMLQVGHFEIEVDLLSVIRSPLIIERVVVQDAGVQVASNDEHESNWAMFDEPAADEDPPADGARKILLRRMNISDVDILIIRPSRPAPLERRSAT